MEHRRKLTLSSLRLAKYSLLKDQWVNLIQIMIYHKPREQKLILILQYRKKSTIDNQERLINNIIIWSKQIEMIMKERI